MSESCSQCNDGFVEMSTYPALYGGEIEISKHYACLCAQGRKHVKEIRGIEEILSPDEVEARWPQEHRLDAVAIETLTRAQVPPAMHRWTLQSYRERFGATPSMVEVLKRADAWLGLDLSARSDWVLMGPNGTGKTGLAVGLLRGAIDQGHSVQFWTVKHLSIVWRASYDAQLFERRDNTKREIELRELLLAPDVLVLDEFGGTSLTDFVETTITDLVDARQKQLRPTIITVNLAAEDLTGQRKQIYERVTRLLGPTLTDRLRERAQMVPLVGGSARKAWGKG